MKCLESLALGLALGLAIGSLVTLTLIVLIKTYEKTGTPTSGYSNKEEWEFIKDPKTGRVIGVRVHRKARYG